MASPRESFWRYPTHLPFSHCRLALEAVDLRQIESSVRQAFFVGSPLSITSLIFHRSVVHQFETSSLILHHNTLSVLQDNAGMSSMTFQL